ncbi:MAG: glycosyltransferase, partial [Salinimicrobium sp.]
MVESKKNTAIFIMPRASTAWRGAEAMWISVAGIAAAAKKKYGSAVVVTSDKIAQPEEVLGYPLLGPVEDSATRLRKTKILPAFLRTIFSDFLLWKNRSSWKITERLDLDPGEIAFVWEKHDLFPGPGRKLANKWQVPFVSYVHAPVVWEASKWGVKRFFWGKWFEKYEAACLKKADYVGAVSEEVKRKLITMGIDEKKIFVSPMAVDPEPFEVREEIRNNLREELNIKDKFAIGWTGSFRSFHGMDYLIRAFSEISKKHKNVVLILVGEGNELEETMELASNMKVSSKVIFTGRKA